MGTVEPTLEHGPGAAPEGVGLETEKMRDAIAQRLFDAPRAPPKVGRFAVIDTIGRGGMGTVLSAWDPQLDRRVAVKVLHGQPSQQDRDRLLEEARALARLNHPNVVTVHEAGLSDGRVYMAMEFVEGGTLRDACAEIPPSQRGRDRRVHAMFVDAARGLAAAHRVGLVHRDVKPANMLIDADGRLRLADFGLARAEAVMTGDHGEPSTTVTGDHTPPGPLKDHSGWVGTPAYMAPEQFDGHADEKSDQFNLCASFWEIVYGRPPYAGSTLSETCGNVIEGRLQEPAPGTSAPPWLRRILLRGIAIDPAQRFADVATLLSELERQLSRSRGRWLGGGLVAAAGVAAVVLSRGPSPEDVTARCVAEADARAPVFDDSTRARIAGAFASTGLGFADATWSQVEAVLLDYGTRFRDADVQACRSEADPDGTTSRDATRRRGCLDRAALAFDSLTEALSSADASTVQRAPLAAHALPAPERCTEEGIERVLDDPSPRLAAAASELTRAATERNLRRIDEARDRVEAVLDTLTDEDAGIRAYAHQELATLAHLKADNDAVVRYTRAALADAELAGDTNAQVHAWRVMSLAHARRAEPEAADLAIERMDSLARRDDVPLTSRARAEWGAGSTLVALKRYADALPRFEHALAVYERDIRSAHLLASLRCDYSEALFVQDHIDAAIDQASRCRAAHVETIGALHPFVAVASLQLSQYQQWAGEFDAAIASADTAREILDANPWFSPLYRVYAHRLRGVALQRAGDSEAAMVDFEAGLRLAIELQGPDGYEPVLIRTDMSNSLVELGREDDARAVLEAAVESGRRNPAIVDSAKGTPLLNLAAYLAHHGEPEAALEHLQGAREVLDEARPISSSLGPSYWVTVAQVYRESGRLAEAREALDRALRSIEIARVDPARKGRVVAEDARLLAESGRDDLSAPRVEEARALLREGGKAGEAELRELEAWVEGRARSP